MATLRNYSILSIFTNQVMKFYNTADTHFVSLKAPAAQGADFALTLPGADVTSGAVVSNGSGVLSIALLVNANVDPAAAIAYSKLAALTSAHILVGNGSNVATDVAVSGDVTLANTGAVTVATVGGSTAANIHIAELAVNVGPSKTLYVDKSWQGTYTADGSILRPFKTIGAAITQIITNADNSTNAYAVIVNEGNYNEALSFNSALLFNVSFQANNYSQGQINSVVFGTATTAITSTSNNTQLQSLAFSGFTINGDIVLTGDTNGTNFAGAACVFVGCNIQKANVGVILTNINNVYFYFCAFNSTGSGPITFHNVAFGLLEDGDGIKSGITLNLQDNPGGNVPAQYAGNYLLMERSTLSPTIACDAGSELDTVGGYMAGAVTMNGIWHSYGTVIAGAVTLNSGSSFRNRGSSYSSTFTVNAGATVTNQGHYLYTPTTSANWNTVPTVVDGALDSIAVSGVVKSQTQNLVHASPNGSSGLPTFRALVSADLPATSPGSITLTNTHLLVGNGSNVAADVAASGDLTLANTGAFTIANLAVTNAKIANTTIDLTTKVTGALPIANGGTGQTTANPAFNALSPLTTKGDVLQYTTVNARLAVGTDGQILTADSASSGGIKWATAGAGTAAAANIRGSEGAGTTTLTAADSYWQVFNLSAARTVVLPTTSIAAGYITVLENQGAFDLTVQSSNGSEITLSAAGTGSVGAATICTGKVTLVALVATPTTPANWVVADVYEQCIVSSTLSFYSGGSSVGGTTSAQNFRYKRVGNSASIAIPLDNSAATPAAGSDSFRQDTAPPVRFNNAGIEQNAFIATKIAGSNQLNPGYLSVMGSGDFPTFGGAVRILKDTQAGTFGVAANTGLNNSFGDYFTIHYTLV